MEEHFSVAEETELRHELAKRGDGKRQDLRVTSEDGAATLRTFSASPQINAPGGMVGGNQQRKEVSTVRGVKRQELIVGEFLRGEFWIKGCRS
ncbi:MAG: hypothetical protein R2873_17535 [Caldilineaceae bacterium]